MHELTHMRRSHKQWVPHTFALEKRVGAAKRNHVAVYRWRWDYSHMHDERSDERSEHNRVAYDRTEWNSVDVYKWVVGLLTRPTRALDSLCHSGREHRPFCRRTMMSPPVYQIEHTHAIRKDQSAAKVTNVDLTNNNINNNIRCDRYTQ